ncbi:MAG: hypothetical protein SynsKO_07780 [Synoicihabitans sp.]
MKFFAKTLAVATALAMPFAASAAHHGKHETPLTNQLIVMSLEAAQDKVTQLAEAIPADSYDYRPMEGVSDVSEVLMHLAGANYYIANLLGHGFPEGVNPRELGKGADKSEMIKIYNASVKHAKKAIKMVSAEAMEEEIEFFGMTAPRARLALVMADHQHEHLGQLIAYARANEIVPPWSQ